MDNATPDDHQHADKAPDSDAKQTPPRRDTNRDNAKRDHDGRGTGTGDRKRPANSGRAPAKGGRSSTSGADRKPWSKDSSSSAPRAGRSGDSGGSGRPSRNAGSGRTGGSRAGAPERRLWTRDGKPARNDVSARDRERELTDEEKLARELRSVRPRHEAPEIPDDVQARDLDKVARNELRTLSKENADEVAKHLVMAARLIEEDPELAHRHALSAERRAGRIGVVRETLAITSYAIGDFALALRELRTYRRITGSNNQLPLMVDSERGVGRPDRALELGRSVDRATLPTDVQVSLAIAMSGARLDLNQNEAALGELQIPQLDPDRAYSWSPELFHAYADVLDDLGREQDAELWRHRADRAGDALGESLSAGQDEVVDIVEEELDALPPEGNTDADVSPEE